MIAMCTLKYGRRNLLRMFYMPLFDRAHIEADGVQRQKTELRFKGSYRFSN